MSSMTLILVVSGILSACGDATPTSKPVAPTATTVSSTGTTGPTSKPVAPTATTVSSTGTTGPTATTAGGSANEVMVDTTKFKKPGPYKIGFSNISVVNSWRVQMVRELEQEKTLHPEVSDLFITDAGG